MDVGAVDQEFLSVYLLPVADQPDGTGHDALDGLLPKPADPAHQETVPWRILLSAGRSRQNGFILVAHDRSTQGGCLLKVTPL